MEKLHEWFQENQRSFPWRQAPTPYQVWISEVMLQQTRAIVVIDYFNRWMKAFPDIFSLTRATLEEVIKAWEGLGYYSRARNMHKAAELIVKRWNGQLPDQREDLEDIPGLGPYTIGAILAFGFHQKAVALDGNVLRVLSRYFCIEENICTARVRQGGIARAVQAAPGSCAA